MRRAAFAFLLCAASGAVAADPPPKMEMSITGTSRDKVRLERVKPPTDLTLDDVLPLEHPDLDDEFDYLSYEELLHLSRDLRLRAIDATLDGLFTGKLFFSEHEMEKEPEPPAPPKPRRQRLCTMFAAIETYDSSGTDDAADERLRRDVDLISAQGNDSAGELLLSGGSGGRVGVRRRLRPRLDAGLSLGLIRAPRVETFIGDFTPPTGYLRRTNETRYLRALAEAGVRLPLNPLASFRLGAGAGAGWARSRQEIDARGSFSGTGSLERKRTGFTWEVSPSILLEFSRAWIELGARFAFLPALDGDAAADGVAWDPFGLYLAVGF